MRDESHLELEGWRLASPVGRRVCAVLRGGRWARGKQGRQNSSAGQECTFSVAVSGGGRQEWKSFNRKTHGRQLLGCGREKRKSTLERQEQPRDRRRRPRRRPQSKQP